MASDGMRSDAFASASHGDVLWMFLFLLLGVPRII